ncbi:TPA: hypothetical protein HA225_00520 [Candidatus Micrarchaeota archaeon]|nr:hypothetical protein [Candidatus Micrarchaeota archaeon]HIH30891.1 hypothetical protein [Candidatus Micrarchaeota archaeon]
MGREKSVSEITDEAIADGGYLTLVYFDLHAKSSDEVKNIMVGFISKLTKEKGVLYAVGEIDQPIEKDGIWSTWAEVKLLASDFATLVRIASQYSPIGIEILRPDRVNLAIGDAQGVLLDISQTSQNFTRMIMERVLSKEEVEEYKVKMASRAELGKRLLEKSKS